MTVQQVYVFRVQAQCILYEATSQHSSLYPHPSCPHSAIFQSCS